VLFRFFFFFFFFLNKENFISQHLIRREDGIK